MADSSNRWGERTNTRPLDVAGWIVAPLVLAFLSVATPVLSENSFFFAAHGVSALVFGGILLAVLVIATAGLWGVLIAAKRLLSSTAFDAVTSVLTFVAVFAAITSIVVNLLGAAGSVIAWLAGVAAGALVGLPITWVARRAQAGRVVWVAAVAVTLFPLITIPGLGGSTDEQVSIVFDDTIERSPILLVVADELSYSVISEENGTIRPVFTNLAEFQTTSTTFTNAYATANATHFAVPTMLAGIPDATRIGEYPKQITASGGPLSWLQSRYRVATDSIYFQSNDDGVPFVDLQTGSLVREESGSPMREAAIFALDSIAVVARTALPAPLSDWFPALDDRWYDFWDLEPESTVVGVGGDFVEVLTAPSDPGFVFWHSMVSHTPYVRDYQGQFWSPSSLGLDEAGLGTEAVAELQRQVYAAAAIDFDRQLGWITEQLKKAGTYDDTLIIVTADHGRTFPLETPWRVGDTRQQRWQDVAHVPLLVKEPGQQSPFVVDAVRSTAQISETILQSAGASVSLSTERAPSLEAELVEPPVFWFDLRTGQPGVETYEPLPVVDRWANKFFSPRHPESPFAVGIDTGLIGTPLPNDSAVVATVPAQIDEASSPLRVIEADQEPFQCAAGDHFGLVSHEGLVVGSIAWGAEKDGKVPGWGIVPEFETGEYVISCSGQQG